MLKRSILVAIATLITAGWTSVASAQYGCGNCGVGAYAPITYATPLVSAPIVVGTGCGNCAAPVSPCCSGGGLFNSFAGALGPVPTPWANQFGGCGGCGVQAAPVAQCCAVQMVPVQPAPCCAAPPVASCCGGTPAVYTTPAPLYVVNQGPDYSGPAVMEPYRTYMPPAQYAPPPGYPPYIGGGYGGYGRPYAPYHRVAYGGMGYYHPRAWGPRYYGRPYMHRPY
jgi:hypothetical protein